ncbi:MAG: hypothetical protein ACT4OM_00450 [Actinomycetota bacterium]
MEFDEAENARAALRALWSMSGQMDAADRLGTEEEGASCHHSSANVGTSHMAHGGESSSGVGFAAYIEGTNEATFDRGEAAQKFKEAWRSQLTLDGKMGGKPLKESAAKPEQD